MHSFDFRNQGQGVLLAMKLTLCLLPFAAASVPLLWFNFGRGDAWAHSLFNTQHPLNFGGNPSEVFSHLLNCIVMAVAISTLCVALLITLWGQCHQLGSPSGAKPDLPLFVRVHDKNLRFLILQFFCVESICYRHILSAYES